MATELRLTPNILDERCAFNKSVQLSTITVLIRPWSPSKEYSAAVQDGQQPTKRVEIALRPNGLELEGHAVCRTDPQWATGKPVNVGLNLQEISVS